MLNQKTSDLFTVIRKDRYKSSDGGEQIEHIWHPDYELFWISEKILEWYYNDEFGIIIVHGQQGFGKSTYACISGAEVYGHNRMKHEFYYNWDAVKKHIVWTPRDFIKLSKKRDQGKEPYEHKEPLVIWDDAGYWLNAMDFRDKLCITVSKYLEVARTRWAAIIFTVSDQRQILSKIRGIPHAWSIPIIKASTPGVHNPNYKWVHDRRYAHLHKSWVSEDLKKSGKKGQEGDVFYARMPPKFYRWYKAFRDRFCMDAIEDVDKAEKESKLTPPHQNDLLKTEQLID